ncbi:unnamed protein product [Rotaria socialis]|uniref:Uncharacterized protein n=1 Tax=Rotaria socialis TaxID=392032 RepID=A0A821END0_9BILA|nr:unnamed protein product [Rotaria socialis]CAF4640163.1 unnamed protein product [Rotaria socialis]
MDAHEHPREELESDMLIDILQELQNGLIRKPDHFNNMHFLLLLLYDSHGYPRDHYPLWRCYHRLKKKLLTAKRLVIDNDKSRQCILEVMKHLIDATPSTITLLEESVLIEEHYLHFHIHGLFKSYSCLHTYLYMEQIDKPILNEDAKIFNLFKSTIAKLYRYEYCDLIHFAIAHRKTSLLSKMFQEKYNWLDMSMNVATERGWLPLHYAAFVGDKETVKTICDTLSTSAFVFDALSLLIPLRQQRELEKNPSGYILKACGVERETHATKQRKKGFTVLAQPVSVDDQNRMSVPQNSQRIFQSSLDRQTAKNQPPLGSNTMFMDRVNNINNLNTPNDNDIPDADELELSSLPLMQREEFIDKLIKATDNKHMLVPSPLTLACIARCGDKADYEEIVKILLESHLVEYDGVNHECILNRVLDYMHTKEYGTFQHVQVYRDTETEGPTALIFYQFDGFIVNQDVKPASGVHSGSSITLNTSDNDSVASDDGHQTETPTIIRCFLTILVVRDVFIQYPRWDFHVLRENIEEHFVELERALGCRPTILYPDGDVISSRKRSDVTWEVKVKYHLSSETGQSLYMEVDYYFFDSFGDPFADAFAQIYQTPFYISCMTESTVMMQTIFDSFFKRRNLSLWGTVAQRHLEHCLDGVLQIKNNGTTFSTLCTTLNRYYQVEDDPFIEENSVTIQRIFVHAFACCVRRNAKIELNYLIKNHALIYYDSCRTKPSDIRHNILTYCVVRNLAAEFDQLMTNMKTTMHKTYQNSTNPDWQPHIAWREIIHVIIDSVSQEQNGANQQIDFSQLACYGDTSTNSVSIGSIPTLHATGDEYTQCINSRKNLIIKVKRKLQRVVSDANRYRQPTRRMVRLDQQQIADGLSHLTDSANTTHMTTTVSNNVTTTNNKSAIGGVTQTNVVQRSKNILKNVNRLRWGKSERHNSSATNSYQLQCSDQRSISPTATTGFNELVTSKDTISLVSNVSF